MEACDYHIKNVVWKLADDSESLIDMVGTNNYLSAPAFEVVE